MKTIIRKICFGLAYAWTIVCGLAMILVTTIDLWRLLFAPSHSFPLIDYLLINLGIILLWSVLGVPLLVVGFLTLRKA